MLNPVNFEVLVHMLYNFLLGGAGADAIGVYSESGLVYLMRNLVS